MPVPTIKAYIGGKTLDELSEGVHLQYVEVRQALYEHWWCDVACRQSEDQRFEIEEWLGKEMEVIAADENGQAHRLFDGFVLDVELEYEIWGSYTARIKGVSHSYKMDLTPRHFYYSTSSMADIASICADRAKLNSKCTAEPKSRPHFYIQWGETDFQYLCRLADDHQAWLRPTMDGIEILNGFLDGPKLQWRDEYGLLNFKVRGQLGQPSMNGSHYQRSKMESKTYEEVKEEPNFYNSSGPLVEQVKSESKKVLPPGYVPDRNAAVEQFDYEKLLKKESARAIGSKVTAQGVSRNPGVKPGCDVYVAGVLDAQGGYGVTRAIHRWNEKGYLNEFWATLWREYTMPERPVSRPAPGVASGRVVDSADPLKEGRIAVKFYWQEDMGTHFFRILTPHAGADRGMYFVPEVGDEVLVAFEEGDIGRPLVLGSLWNGVDKPPVQDFWGGEHPDNDCKRIVTKSGHRIQIVDKKGKESIVIATPQHVKIALIEDTDESGRATMMLHSDGDIFINAGGRIHCKSAFFSREVG